MRCLRGTVQARASDRLALTALDDLILGACPQIDSSAPMLGALAMHRLLPLNAALGLCRVPACTLHPSAARRTSPLGSPYWNRRGIGTYLQQRCTWHRCIRRRSCTAWRAVRERETLPRLLAELRALPLRVELRVARKQAVQRLAAVRSQAELLVAVRSQVVVHIQAAPFRLDSVVAARLPSCRR